MVERAVRLLDERICFDDLVPTVQGLMDRYPYERQKRYENLKVEKVSGTALFAQQTVFFILEFHL